ncbi:MKI67 FHA domain-interacting nucleolar phosphoprotein-like [Leptopilina heterotoma]|uniref:MKI67 FHA domain-interacting nucleolar phosphoprotein-like n=1 Tax=Leptopilina heterotoma TaxID=63436 RepID=UPI001CA922FC|nr:MKI67 FHA domain-interacting nucleolar phosphoprotein-like [Leptopilina heterotoma]
MKVKKIRPESKSSLKTAVKNVQNILKKTTKKSKKLTEKDDTLETPKKEINDSTEKLPEVELQYNSKAGVIYIGQIPHGFYEDEMKGFFSQFGNVRRVRLVRSKKTGKSRGYGYVEFQTPEVAKIAAETMNNYVMCGRLLRVSYIPPERQHFGFFFGKKITPTSYPRLENRNKVIKLNRAPITETKQKKRVKTSLRKLSVLEKKLKDKGINFTFKPVDLPKSK